MLELKDAISRNLSYVIRPDQASCKSECQREDRGTGELRGHSQWLWALIFARAGLYVLRWLSVAGPTRVFVYETVRKGTLWERYSALASKD